MPSVVDSENVVDNNSTGTSTWHIGGVHTKRDLCIKLAWAKEKSVVANFVIYPFKCV